MIKYLGSLLLLAAIALSASSCATVKRDRCFLSETRYLLMKRLFEETGSYLRVAQAMNEEGWAHCEINQLRYRLRKDEGMEGREFDELFVEYEPSRSDLEVNPGRVEKAIQ